MGSHLLAGGAEAPLEVMPAFPPTGLAVTKPAALAAYSAIAMSTISVSPTMSIVLHPPR